MAKRFVVPFATSGDKSVTPDATALDGSISYSQGWPSAYQLADTDPNYRPVGRQEMNGVFYDVTGAIAELQTLGFPKWVPVTGLVTPYEINAYVRHDDIVYKSVIPNNSSVPGADANWLAVVSVVQATELVAGIAEVATAAEVTAGTDDTRMITPLKLTQRLQSARSASRVGGLQGQNNVGAPTTQFDFAASNVTLRNPTTGATVVVNNTGTLTNNIALAGPAANGRDQAGAFTASQWLRFYFIWNPTTSTLATISSSAAPSVGPTLPAGYTSWAYIGSVYFGSGSSLTPGNMRGSRFNYSAAAVAISGGVSVTPVAVPIPTLVPPECGWFDIIINQLALTSSATGDYSINAAFTTQASSIFSVGFSGKGSASSVFSQSGPSKQISNFGQTFTYSITIGPGTGPSLTVYVSGYSMPNGGE